MQITPTRAYDLGVVIRIQWNLLFIDATKDAKD